MSTPIEQTHLSKTPLCPVETAGAFACTHLNMRVLLFDEVSPLTTHLDSRHICVCSDAPNRHPYPRLCRGLRGVQWSGDTTTGPLWPFKQPTFGGGLPRCSRLSSWDHQRKQSCLYEADGGDWFLEKCHTDIPGVKDWIPLYLLEPLGIDASFGGAHYSFMDASQHSKHTRLFPVQERTLTHTLIRSPLIKLLEMVMDG